MVSEAHVYAGFDPIPATKKGNPIPGQFPYKREFCENPNRRAHFTIRPRRLPHHLGFARRARDHHRGARRGGQPRTAARKGAWAYAGADAIEFEGSSGAGGRTTSAATPQRATSSMHRSRVWATPHPSTKESPATRGPSSTGRVTRSTFWAGNRSTSGSTTSRQKGVAARHLQAPTSGDPRVVNMARLLQSLDYDSDQRLDHHHADGHATASTCAGRTTPSPCDFGSRRRGR